jgi:tetratricopeptide (TPR) repeat protein
VLFRSLSDVIAHNLAFIDLREQRLADGIARLAPRMESRTSDPDSTLATALASLWLRLLHHDTQLERAMAWARDAENNGALTPAVAGIASLIAIDAADLTSATRWSLMDLQHRDPAAAAIESLITQASLALSTRDAPRAREFAHAALQRDPQSGRAWSAAGFAELLAGDFEAALGAFDRALATMPDHIGTWHGRGWTQILQGHPDLARATFEHALALDRNFAESHGSLAVALAMLRRTEEAQLHATLALKLDAGNVSGRYAQALLRGEIRSAADLQRLAHRLLGASVLPPDAQK